MKEAERNLLETTDAREWARQFLAICKKNGDPLLDEGWLISWFANAIETGRTHEYRRHLPPGCGGREALAVLNELLAVQADNLNEGDPYMVGLHNGILTAFNTLSGKDHPNGLKSCRPQDSKDDCQKAVAILRQGCLEMDGLSVEQQSCPEDMALWALAAIKDGSAK